LKKGKITTFLEKIGMAKKKATKKAAKKKVTKKKVAKKKVAKKKVAKKKVAKKKVAKKKVAKKKVAKKKVTKKKVAKKKVAKKKVAKKKVAKKKVAKKKVTKKKVVKKKVVKKTTPKKAAPKKVEAKKVVEAKAAPAKKAAAKKAKKVSKKKAEEVNTKAREEILSTLSSAKGQFNLEDILEAMRSMDNFISLSDECLEKNCDNLSTTGGYCRVHYIKNWDEIKNREKIIKQGKLNEVIKDVLDKFPIKVIQDILDDLQDDKTFFRVLKELNIDSRSEAFDDTDDEDIEDDRDIAYETKGTFKTINEAE
jgi:hypothetical protein